MKVRKASSIDRLHEKVRGFDRVLTVQAPLADAINNRLDRPKLDPLAVTPKRLVYKQHRDEDLVDRRGLFIHTIRETNLSWKQAFYLLENTLSCWQESGDLRKILEYERFDNEDIRKVIQIIEDTPNIYTAMEKSETDGSISTAVLGFYQFNELDKNVLPEQYTKIGFFDRPHRKLPNFRIFGTVTGILQSLRRNITRENAEDFAIVVSPESEYQSLIKSVFQTDNIPFMSGTNFEENENLRTFIFLLRSSLTGNRLRLRDIQPVLGSLNLHIPEKFNEEFLRDLEMEEIEVFLKIMDEMKKSTFEKALEYYEKYAGDLGNIREVLSEIDFLEKKVNEENLNRLEYYLDTFDIQVEQAKDGVLFASPKSVSHIDRSVVFYIGMDSLWTHTRPNKPWLNEEKFEEKNLKNFKLLLQNGEQQYFLVRDSRMGEEITPCLYFDEIFERDFDSFSDLPNKEYWGLEKEEVEGFEKQDFGVKVEPVEVISQSDLNKFVQSPRQYFFSKLIPTQEKDYLKKGALFHDFAEFCLNFPKLVQKKGIDEFVEVMAEELRPHIEDFDLDRTRTEIRIGMENIRNYLKEEDFDVDQLPDYEKKNEKNIFSQYFGKRVELPIGEAWFENLQLGCRGKVDLIKDHNELVDYKSGRLNSAKRIVESSKIELFEDNPNFQAILYLLHHRQERPDKKLKFTFFHFLDNKEDKISGDAKLDDNIVTITYYPVLFEGQVYKRETYDHLVENVSESNNRRKTLERMGYQSYRDFFESNGFPRTYDREELLTSDLCEEFINYSKDIVGDYKFVEKGCKSALSKILRFRRRNYFKEDLDAFEDFLDEQLENLNGYKRDRFPVGEVDLDKIENRELILGGNF